ncbi:DsbA family oxidoreductase [Paenibacillus beijingensis]|uniref:DSBA oxidoreductase n=1 Tax=Paenibacillus beijingensis TaxID=1126833 RepID=A0A0D5NHI5_9BACL|nr:DsbA family oxidoreductase [Paenibacillus beijingensis]AJY74590.1 DSBA oxidoreductase [Paenibacillus beijingensis]
MLIEIYQDVVCPWCRIGKKNLFDALSDWKARTGTEPTIQYRAYQLDPNLPPEGMPFMKSMTHKSGSSESVRRMMEHVTGAGADVGLTFRFDQVSWMPNTRMAHRLIALTPEAQRTELIDSLFRAYFEEGVTLSRQEELLAIGEAAGWQREQLAARLNNGEGSAEVDDDLERGKRLGISGVPLFIFNRKYALSGAYPKSEMLLLLDRFHTDA